MRCQNDLFQPRGNPSCDKNVQAQTISRSRRNTAPTYVALVGDTLEELKRKTESVIDEHLEWLQLNGMVCNRDKTEVMLMNSQEDEDVKIRVGDVLVRSSKSMKVLGLTFDHKLDWTQQVHQTIMKTNRLYHGLWHIKKFLNPTQLRSAVTAYYFSVLYYGLEVWFHRNLSFKLKQRLRSAHYRALRLVFGKEKSRTELDVMSKRATPDEMADYSLAKMVSKMCISGQPQRLLSETMSNSYSVLRSPGRMFFYDNSKLKIGRQCLKNRLSCVTKQMKFNWLECEVKSLRPKLKKCFFKYAMS